MIRILPFDDSSPECIALGLFKIIQEENSEEYPRYLALYYKNIFLPWIQSTDILEDSNDLDMADAYYFDIILYLALLDENLIKPIKDHFDLLSPYGDSKFDKFIVIFEELLKIKGESIDKPTSHK